MNPDFSLEKRIAYRFSVLSTINMRCVANFYSAKFGLSTAGWRIMSIIGRYEPIFPGVAAQLSTMDADKVTRAVDRLVDMGYVVRNVDAADRRRVILCLTSKGHSVYGEIEEISQTLDAEWRSALTPAENRAFDDLVDKLEIQAKQLFSGESADKRFAALLPARASRKKVAAKRTSAAPPAKKAAALSRA